jgi:hypothetical protein
MGCDYAQGFHVGRPAAADQCRRYLVEQEPAEPVRLAVVAAAGGAS